MVGGVLTFAWVRFGFGLVLLCHFLFDVVSWVWKMCQIYWFAALRLLGTFLQPILFSCLRVVVGSLAVACCFRLNSTVCDGFECFSVCLNSR